MTELRERIVRLFAGAGVRVALSQETIGRLCGGDEDGTRQAVHALVADGVLEDAPWGHVRPARGFCFLTREQMQAKREATKLARLNAARVCGCGMPMTPTSKVCRTCYMEKGAAARAARDAAQAGVIERRAARIARCEQRRRDKKESDRVKADRITREKLERSLRSRDAEAKRAAKEAAAKAEAEAKVKAKAAKAAKLAALAEASRAAQAALVPPEPPPYARQDKRPDPWAVIRRRAYSKPSLVGGDSTVRQPTPFEKATGRCRRISP